MALFRALELGDLRLELGVPTLRGAVPLLHRHGLALGRLVARDALLAEFREIDHRAHVAPRARVLGLGQVAQREVGDAAPAHQVEETTRELEVPDGLLVQLGELQDVRGVQLGRVHRLARLAAQQNHHLLVRAVQRVRVRLEKVLLGQGDVELTETRDDLVVPQDGEAVRGGHRA